jgi:hypothetical protein
VPRPCLVCTHLQRQAIEGMILAGEPGYTIGRQFNIERVSVGRHPRRHVIQPMQDRLAILAKDADARDRRAPCRR